MNDTMTVEIYRTITNELINSGNRILGINGVDCSGKTTFTANYAEYLTSIGVKNTIIHIDDYHNPRKMRSQGENEIDSYYENAFNYTQLIDEVFKPLRDIGSIDKSVLCLNLDTDKYENVLHYLIDSETVVLVEGVLLFRPPLIDYIDGKIFLHVSFDEVIKRATARDVPKYGESFLNKYKNKYIPIQTRYLSEFEPHTNCDIFIDNNDYENPKINLRRVER